MTVMRPVIEDVARRAATERDSMRHCGGASRYKKRFDLIAN
jgi:hypothetical protein